MDDVQTLWARQRTLPARVGRTEVWPRPTRLRIPSFPVFVPLAIEHQYEIEQWAKQFPPYADFNFVSLWSWNTTGACEVCWLGDNLVVLFNDYMTNEPFLTFLGVDDVEATANRLMEYARSRGLVEELRLIPEFVALAIPPRSGLAVQPSPEHDDYILSTRDWSELAGGHFRKKRNEISRFQREHAPISREIDLGDPAVQQAVQDVFGQWIVDRRRAGLQETVNEAVALRRLFSLDRPQDLLGIGCFVDERLVGFTINERINDGFVIGHYCKAIGGLMGVYAYLIRQTARVLLAEGYERLNIMQDLGIPGLGSAKQRYRPVGFLRKYQIVPHPAVRPRVTERRIAIVDMPRMHGRRWTDRFFGG